MEISAKGSEESILEGIDSNDAMNESLQLERQAVDMILPMHAEALPAPDNPFSPDATIMQGGTPSDYHSNHDSNQSQPSGQNRFSLEDSFLGQAKPWLQSSVSNYADRIRAQASAEVRASIYRLLIQVLPVGIGFIFGLDSLSGAYFLLRGQLPNLPIRQIPSQGK